MTASQVQTIVLLVISLYLPECNAYEQQPQGKAHKITVTTVQSKPVTITQQYTCQIHSLRHIVVRALAPGRLATITMREGQMVNRNDLLFQIRPLMDKEELVSIRAPFDGIVDRLHEQKGSLVKEGDSLTTLSDNSVMWVYFNMPEKRYLDYMAETDQERQSRDIELMLADHSRFPKIGKIVAIEANFNKNGTIAFRADFSNPDGLLRHGETGTVLINRVLKDAIVIPQLATFKALNKRYVYVVDKSDIAHQREIVVQNEVDDLFVVEKGVGVGNKIVSDGVGMVRDGDKVKE